MLFTKAICARLFSRDAAVAATAAGIMSQTRYYHLVSEVWMEVTGGTEIGGYEVR